VTVGAAMGAGLALAQAPAKEKQVKDQVEWNLFNDSTKTADAAKRLGFLNTWKEKYPESDFKDARLLIYLTTYQALNQPAKMVETAKEILAMNPKEPHALLALTMLTATFPNPPTPDSLATGEKAAQGLLEAEKPAEVKDEATWKKIKTEEAHKAVIFIALQRKQPEAAEQEYAKWLAEDPGQAQISYALGNTILSEKKQERYSEMLYHWGRAASLTGPGAMPEAQRKQVDAYFVKQYNAIHGPDEAGLKEFRALAVSRPMPPAGFKIKTKNEIDAENQEKFAKDNPQLALWKGVKDALVAANGEQYFEGTLKGSAVPKLKGKLVSMKPAIRPKELVLAIDTPNTPEVTLKFENPLPGKAEPGTEIEFEGVPGAFTKEPFMLTFDVDGKDKIAGWPAQAAPPAGKTASRTKKN
jgi:hypothetical protein